MRTIIALTLVCLAATAFAGNHPDVESMQKLDNANIRQINLSSRVDADIVLGNTNDPVNEMADWAYGNEAYTYYVKQDQAESCPEGFAPLNVTFYMTFGPEDVPVTFPIQGALRGAVDDGTGVMTPGDRVAETPTYELLIEEAGAYEIVVPFAEEEIACVPNAGPWFAEMYLPISFEDDRYPGILTDEDPVEGNSYYNYFLLGWEDLILAYTWPGGAVVKIEAACCENSVATEAKTFGGMKTLYR